jgi:hypothetical protein
MLLPPLPAGAILCLHNQAGAAALDRVQRTLEARYRMEVVERFSETITPLLPDVMVNPAGAQQDVLGWVLRYAPQTFETVIIRVDGPREAGRGPDNP